MRAGDDMNPIVASALTGVAWGLVAAYFTSTSTVFGSIAWMAAFSWPLIGVFIYLVSRFIYRRSVWWMIPWTLVSTYLALILFGLALGIADAMRPIPRNTIAVIAQSVLMCLWGFTFIPFFWLFLLPVAGNHALIRWLERKKQNKLQYDSRLG